MSTPATTPEATATKLEMSVNRDVLIRELAFARGLTEAKTTVPILTSLLFAAEGNTLTITATDLERSVVTSIPATVKKPGSVAIHGRKLFEYVKFLPSGDITLKEMANNWLAIRSGRSNTKMVAMSRANYPQVHTIEEAGSAAVSLPARAIKTLIGQTSFAISKEESRYTLNGTLFGVEPSRLFMVATDGHRLALSETRQEVTGVKDKSTALIPLRAVGDLASLLSDSDVETVSFAQNDTYLFFSVGERKYSVRRLAGQFPHYEAILPRNNDKVVIVAAADMERSIRRVATFADDRSSSIKLSLSENSLKLSASSTENGESEDLIEIVYGKDSMITGFNASYLLDFIKAIGGKGEIKMLFKDGGSPVLLRPEVESPDTDFHCVVMPLRIAA